MHFHIRAKRVKGSVSDYLLQKKCGIFGWTVNSKAILVCPTGKFPE